MKNKVFSSVCIVLGIIIVITTSTSFAYFNSSTSTNENDIAGATNDFDVELNINNIYEADELIPISDNLISIAISKDDNKCIDSKGYQVCSLYNLTLSNSGSPQILNSYIKTVSSTYTTSDLKCQLFDSNFSPASSVMTLSHITGEKMYFENNSNIVSSQINNTDITYYLVIWITETGMPQSADYLKDFSGLVGFELLTGEYVEVDFNS